MPIFVQTLPMRVCDVCRLVDGDLILKPCAYCGLCDSWICQEDQNRWGRRAKAALKRKLEQGYKGLADVAKLFEGAPKDTN